MASILSSLGLGPPNPAAFSDASAVASQLKKAMSNLQSTISSMNIALTGAKMIGLPSSITDKLQALITKGNTLMTTATTSTPAQLEAARASMESEFMTTQFQAIQTQYTTTLADLNTLFPKIQTRVAEIYADSSTSVGLLSQYDALQTDISGAIATLLASPPVYTNTDLSGSSGSNTVYVVPTTPLASDFQDRLDSLEGLKEAEEGGGFSLPRIYKRVKNWISVHFYSSLIWVVVLSSMVLGGIVLSNSYIEAEQGYMLNRLFYFIYGAIGFPFSLILGCYKPPFWSAGLFPAYLRKAVQSGGGVTPSQVAALSVRIPLGFDITSADIMGTPAAQVQAPAPAQEPVEEVDLGIQQETAESPANPTSAFDIFSFTVVDSSSPPAYQVTGKKTLRYISMVHMAMLALFGVHYGFF